MRKFICLRYVRTEQLMHQLNIQHIGGERTAPTVEMVLKCRHYMCFSMIN